MNGSDIVKIPVLLVGLAACVSALGWAEPSKAEQSATQITVAADGSARFHTVQSAVDALPESGGTITLKPGIYREKVLIAKSNVRLLGAGKTPSDVVIVYDDSAGTAGGTGKSFTVEVSGNDFTARNLTIQNDFSVRHPEATVGAQAVALHVIGDREVFDHVRLLGAQDTLYAAGKTCSGSTCRGNRQYFHECYIEGHVDFIFGNARAVFDHCEIHGIAHSTVMLTAQSKNAPDEDSAYVFDHCTVTADPGVGTLFLGRPWRPYATVVFLNTRINANLHPEGWSEWTPGKTNSLETAYYAEYKSSGIGANQKAREPHSHQLSAKQAREFSPDALLARPDGWHPKL